MSQPSNQPQSSPAPMFSSPMSSPTTSPTMSSPPSAQAPWAGYMTVEHRPVQVGDTFGIHVEVDPDRWAPEVVMRTPIGAADDKKALARLPFPGAIAPVPGGESFKRGERFERLSEADVATTAASWGDPWAIAQSITPAIACSLPKPALQQVMSAMRVLAYRELIVRTGKFVLDAMDECASNRLLPQAWLWDAFLACQRAASQMQARSLNEAFNVPSMTDRARETVGSRPVLIQRVMRGLIAEIIASPTLPINKKLFAKVAKRSAVSTSQCELLYKEARAAGFQDLAYLRKKLLAERGQGPRGASL